MKTTFAVLVALTFVSNVSCSSPHLRVLKLNAADETCTIMSESQCDGQGWTMSTCCRDPRYECRWDDFDQNVKRCQKIATSSPTSGPSAAPSTPSITYGQTNWIELYGDCSAVNVFCQADALCVRHSQYYSQCMPYTLSQGELCGQNDGVNLWKYDYCQTGSCQPVGSDFFCKV